MKRVLYIYINAMGLEVTLQYWLQVNFLRGIKVWNSSGDNPIVVKNTVERTIFSKVIPNFTIPDDIFEV